ncbi:MAG: hypothetical protein R2831_09140 [Chitinophagaceae bacterium]
MNKLVFFLILSTHTYGQFKKVVLRHTSDKKRIDLTYSNIYAINGMDTFFLHRISESEFIVPDSIKVEKLLIKTNKFSTLIIGSMLDICDYIEFYLSLRRRNSKKGFITIYCEGGPLVGFGFITIDYYKKK